MKAQIYHQKEMPFEKPELIDLFLRLLKMSEFLTVL